MECYDVYHLAANSVSLDKVWAEKNKPNVKSATNIRALSRKKKHGRFCEIIGERWMVCLIKITHNNNTTGYLLLGNRVLKRYVHSSKRRKRKIQIPNTFSLKTLRYIVLTFYDMRYVI